MQFTGLRPGEKLFEEIALSEEHADKTRHPKVYVGRVRPQDADTMRRHLEALRAVAQTGDGEMIRRRIKAVVPEYRGGEGAVPPAAGKPAVRVVETVG